MQIIEVFSAPYFLVFGPFFFSIGPLLIATGADIRSERFRSKPMSAPKGLGRGPNATSFAFSGPFLFSIWAPLNYQGVDIRTERFRSKPISAPKGLGRGPTATSFAFSGPFFFQFGPLLITKGPIPGPNCFVQNRYRLPRNWAGDRMQIILFFRPPYLSVFGPS